MQTHARQTSDTELRHAHVSIARKEPIVSAPRFDLLDGLTAYASCGSRAEAHALALNRMSSSRASRVLGQSVLRLQRQYGNRYVQRVLAIARQSEGEGEVAPQIEAAIERARGGGQCLDRGVQLEMESSFDASFGNVRIHTGSEADTLNREVNAVAFTTGRDIFFSHGAYDPNTLEGKKLLAHELTHVLQQSATSLQGKLVVGASNDASEEEADRVAEAVVSASNSTSVPLYQASGFSDSATVNRQCGCVGPTGNECEACRQTRESTRHRSTALQRQDGDGGGGEVSEQDTSGIANALTAIASADPETVVSDPDSASQWIEDKLSSLPPVGEQSGSNEGAPISRKPLDETADSTGHSGRAAGSAQLGALVQRQTAAQTGGAAGSQFDPNDVDRPPSRPIAGCCNPQYDTMVDKYWDMKKQEAETLTAVRKARAAAVAAKVVCSGGLLPKKWLPPDSQIPTGPVACIVAAATVIGLLQDANKENEKWGVTIRAYYTARDTFWACWKAAGPQVCPASGWQVTP